MFDKTLKNVSATLGPTQPSYNFPETLHLRYVFAGWAHFLEWEPKIGS